jgi:hypothetical protein
VSVYIFTGPTLSPEVARPHLDAIYLPPAALGDVYRASLSRPTVIGIIDGYFERVPAVWHKEILWALAEGIHVFGAASLGALRAAELAAFGMEGVGAVFQAFVNGTLTDDDEVAVAHAHQEHGFRAQSEAMVNIRCTLELADNNAIISHGTRSAIEDIAKNLFYPERSYPIILDRATVEGLPATELEALRDWLPTGKVDQKRDDALLMLRAIKERLAADTGPKQVRFHFEYTTFWDEARREAGWNWLGIAEPGEGELLEWVLDELRLDSNAYTRVREKTLLRRLAIDRTLTDGVPISRDVLQETADAFRRARDLLTAEDTDRWLAANHLDRKAFGRLMEDEARLGKVCAAAERELTHAILDHLRATGHYAQLEARARKKRETLRSLGLDRIGLNESGLSEEGLLQWYFVEQLGASVVTDVQGYAASLGFLDKGAFIRSIQREFCFRRVPFAATRPSRTSA